MQVVSSTLLLLSSASASAHGWAPQLPGAKAEAQDVAAALGASAAFEAVATLIGDAATKPAVVEAMRRCDDLKRPFSFPTLIVAPRSSGGLATEAFEASELTVQMAAERVLELAGDQPTEADARVRTRDVSLPRPRVSSLFFTVVVGLGRGPPRVTTWFRGDDVLISTSHHAPSSRPR